VKFGIVLACEDGHERTVTQDWIDSEENVFSAIRRVEDMATARYQDFELEGRMSPIDAQPPLIILTIPGSDPNLRHWFWLQRVAREGKPAEQ
jgi:hypothetical protein